MRTISYLRIAATEKNLIQKIYPGHPTNKPQAKNSPARLVIYLGIACYLMSFFSGKGILLEKLLGSWKLLETQ